MEKTVKKIKYLLGALTLLYVGYFLVQYCYNNLKPQGYGGFVTINTYGALMALISPFVMYFVLHFLKYHKILKWIVMISGITILCISVFYFIKFPPFKDQMNYKDTVYADMILPSWSDFLVNAGIAIVLVIISTKLYRKIGLIFSKPTK